MEVIRTAKLKLTCSRAESDQLHAVTGAYRDAQNHCSRWAFENGKTSSNKRIHDACYSELRERYGLSAQLSCSVERSVASTFQGLWTKVKDSVKRREGAVARKVAGKQKGRLPKVCRGLDSAPTFRKATAEQLFGRDWSFKTGHRVSLTVLGGRLIVPFEGWDGHVKLLADPETEIGSGKLHFDKGKKQWYLLVSFTAREPDRELDDYTSVVGVDVGQRYHAVVKEVDLSKDRPVTMYSGVEHRKRADHLQGKRAELQAKGTRSAKRRFVAMSQRERRFTADRNHVLSKSIASGFRDAIIAMEELTHIRERTERGSRKAASRKMKRSNRVRSTWSFAALRALVTYKAPLYGNAVAAVDPAFTSQACPKCAYTSRDNRPGGGELFKCVKCGFEAHADVVGSTNVGMRAWLAKRDGTLKLANPGQPDEGEEALEPKKGKKEEGRRSAVPGRLSAVPDAGHDDPEAGQRVGAHKANARRPELRGSVRASS